MVVLAEWSVRELLRIISDWIAVCVVGGMAFWLVEGKSWLICLFDIYGIAQVHKLLRERERERDKRERERERGAERVRK